MFDTEKNATDAIYKYSIWASFIESADKEWRTFRDELIHNYRFSSDSKIVKELHKRENDAVYTLKKESNLFRARIYKENPYDKVFPQMGDYALDEHKGLIVDYLLLQNDPYQIAIYNAWVKEAFKGYNAEESGAPPVDKTCDGRANPNGIRYLYLCEDYETSVYEIRPIIGQLVNCAVFKANHDLKIYDLTKKFASTDPKIQMEVPELFDSIGKHFSLPCKGTPLEYLPTQFLAEEIRKMGFDGLRFESSLRKGGINAVIFNPDDFTAVSSDIFKVGDINLEIKPAEIYGVGQESTNSTNNN